MGREEVHWLDLSIILFTIINSELFIYGFILILYYIHSVCLLVYLLMLP